MINLLFKTSKRAPAKWNLRKWDLGGKIIVSGLEDDPVPFTKTEKKLEQYWEEGIPGLPGDLSRLLVVKAGETVLTEEEEDGVGRGILKNYLSGEGLLDKIAARISKILQVTTVQESLIHGAQKGEVKKRMEREDRLRSLNALLEAVEQEYASGEVYSLRQKKQTIEAEQKKLEKAKRHYAAQLYNLTQTKRREKDELPTEEELAKLEADIGVNSKKTEAEERPESRDAQRTGRHQRGLQVDRESPRLLLRDHKQTYRLRSKTDLDTYHVALLCGRAGHRLSWTQHPPRHLWHGDMVFFILYYVGTRNVLARSGESTELDSLKADFRSRFGSEFTNKAVLEVQLEKLKENHIRATSLREEVDKLTLKIDSSRISIRKP